MYYGNLEGVKAQLAAGADVNARAPKADNSTVLMLASYKGNIEIIHALLDKGAAVNARNDFGFTALMLASQEGHAEAQAPTRRGGRGKCEDDGEREERPHAANMLPR